MDAIINTPSGPDVLMNKICGCYKCQDNWTLTDCENQCERYYNCYNVAVANDILKEKENEQS